MDPSFFNFYELSKKVLDYFIPKLFAGRDLIEELLFLLWFGAPTGARQKPNQRK